MKIEKVNLEYYVFYLDFSSKEIKRLNILAGLEKEIAKKIHSKPNTYKHISDRDSLKDFLKTEFMYHYWCKCEWEYCISNLWEKDFEKAEKRDVWFQIEKNLDTITDYIIYKMGIKF